MRELELMAMHCNALYVHNEARELVCVNDWLTAPAPSFWLGFTREGILHRFREDVSATIRARLGGLIAEESTHAAPRAPRFHKSYLSLLGAREATAGPTYWLSSLPTSPDRRIQRISAANATVLRESALNAWVPDIPHQQPMFASLDNGLAVSICASVRVTENAHEVGVETISQYRCRGHASAVVSAWAGDLLSAGIVPLYSTSWNNLASQQVARRIGFERFGWEYRIG